ncbi:hypothetical protein QYE76_057160 [Lolium multiflorum]|uniref:Uncharacterized protein n=1 Tax=Lolium multiflorum TaxID=4521 RepID=A0AAD8T2Z2_LOLMU|nr:hypothetical protein QYE76_057160 [Lolium multiflorum]
MTCANVFPPPWLYMVDTGGTGTPQANASMAEPCWEHVVQMCRHLHPEVEEEVAAAGVEAQQLDLVAAAEVEVAEAVEEVAERAEGRLAATRAEIANAKAELDDARAELAEARVAIAAPPADAVIHDIADDDPPVPRRFECAGNQRVLLASFESLARDAQRRQAWMAEEEAHSYAMAMARGLMCSDMDSLQRRGPSPARVEQENRELEAAFAARDEREAARAGPASSPTWRPSRRRPSRTRTQRRWPRRTRTRGRSRQRRRRRRPRRRRWQRLPVAFARRGPWTAP